MLPFTACFRKKTSSTAHINKKYAIKKPLLETQRSGFNMQIRYLFLHICVINIVFRRNGVVRGIGGVA